MTRPSSPIYLDYNATAPLHPLAREEMLRAYSSIGNASSIHHFGRVASRFVESARDFIAEKIQADASEIIFTSGGSEGNNQILQHFERIGGQIFISAVEHDAVRFAVASPYIIPVDRQGVVDLGALERLLATRDSQKPVLVSVMLANNETGVVQPLKQITELAKKFGAKVHTDAVQALGRLALSFEELGVDYMTLSGHKIGGPFGVGAIVVKKGQEISPLIRGGGQEKYRRAGTLNTPAIAGFAVALRESLTIKWDMVQKLRDTLETQIQAFCPESEIFGQKAPRLSNTSCIRMPGVKNETQLINFDLEGIAVSNGSACSSGKIKTSHVLENMGISSPNANEALRVSLAPQTTRKDIDRFIEVWKNIYTRLGLGKNDTQ